MVSVSRCILTLITLFPLIAWAAADGPDYWALRDDVKQEVPLHSEPLSDSDIIFHLPAYSYQLKNLGCKGGATFEQFQALSEDELNELKESRWCKVSKFDNQGWVQGKLLREDGLSPVQPSFDCQNTKSFAPGLVCRDSSLAELDQQLSDVYNKARQAAKALDTGAVESVKQLSAYQGGWVRGRNECWKSRDDVKECIKTSYERRIAELQATWDLVEVEKTDRYSCDNRAEFYVRFYNTDTMPAVVVEYGDSREIMISTKVASGARYDGTFGSYIWLKGDEGQFLWDQSEPLQTCNLKTFVQK